MGHSRMILCGFVPQLCMMSAVNRSFIRIFISSSFCLCRRLCLLISHTSAQDGEMTKEIFICCLVPCSPPLTQLSTLRRGEAKQTAVQTPQIITQESHWERCVGSGCDSVRAPVVTDIRLRMSRPHPIRSHG